ncbi:MAG TPA: hypothetical protein VHJ76_04610 [Actinomycetota bacterium]|nr:hypothetical protein [Actinomycetota bacterium]
MKMTDLMSSGGIRDVERLGRFLVEHGVDLTAAPSPCDLARGTPVYVDVGSDPVEVQRRMAQAHVRMLFVLDDGVVAGVVDAAELARRAESLAWTPQEPPPRTP